MKLFESPMLVTLLCGLCFLAGLDAPPAYADFTFGERVNLGPVVNSPYEDGDPFIAPDGLSLYFDSERPGGLGGNDIWVTTRATISDPWGPPVNLGAPVNSEYADGAPSISADGLTLAFISKNRPGGLGLWDIWVSTRQTKNADWGPPENLGAPVNSSGNEFSPLFSADGCSLYFCTANGTGNMVWGGDIYVTTRPTKDSPWGQPVNLGLMPGWSGGNWNPSLSADGLALFFDSDYPGGSNWPNIWWTTRASTNANWGNPIQLGPEINTEGGEQKPSISADGSTLYWCAGPKGASAAAVAQFDLWQSTISPIVDFNGDGLVDSADMCIVVDHWGEDYPLCDIGPMPWGDGVVDVQDLIVLAEHLFEDCRLIAHWELDEIEGMGVADSAGDNNAYALGNPVWQPDGGQVGGALLLDGVDDFISAPAVLNPANGPFSLLAWIRGGGPGQVIVSQEGGASWLMADAEGKLRTELQGFGRLAGPLQSQTIITDGQWHRIGLVWDGSRRTLYVDGVVAAEDTQGDLPSSGNGLYIGTGKNMEPGTFWSGLIDDVRIYNRAVKP